MRRVVLFGDSYVAARPGYAQITPALLGCRGTALGLGGTGFVKTSDGRPAYPSRLPQLLAAQADLVIVQSTGNDAVCSLDEVEAETGRFLTRLEDMPAVYILGPMWAKDGSDRLAELRDRTAKVCADLGRPFVDGLSWLTHDLIGPDGAHPTLPGHWRIARQLTRALREHR